MGERIAFRSNGDEAQGYLARPEGGTGIGVVVIQEWWGLVPHIEDVCERFAAEGFVALAPDLYHGAATREPDDAMRLMMGLAMDRAARDIAGAAAYLNDSGQATGKGVGCVGFCMGGSLALWSATVSDAITATVGFYPAMPWARMSPTWARYDGKAALIHTDEHEGGVAAEGITQARDAIAGAGGEAEALEYPGTDHAFFNDTRPGVFNADAAALAWRRTAEFLRARLAV